ncbi:MAG TPA: YdjY domain-containing protein [Caulifigura sp.]|nr:YdjY domain-containing protein [Caulifigura sp.]
MVFRLLLAVALLGSSLSSLQAAEPVAVKPTDSSELEGRMKAAVPLNPQKSVLLDKPNGRLYLQTSVALREGLLEMFLCKKQTKEHESVLMIDSSAQVIHAGLLAAGAKSGRPAKFQPAFSPPEGDRIDIWVHWKDEAGKPHQATAQSWIRSLTRRYYAEKIGPLPAGLTIPKDGELRYDPMNEELIWFGIMSKEQEKELAALSKDETFRKAIHKFQVDSQPRGMKADFIFAGAMFVKNPDGTEFYSAEAGNLICVANFADAIVDVNIRSSDVNADASFEPNTPEIPPLRTPVVVELVPLKGSYTPAAESQSK